MTKAKQSGAFKGHRFPPEIISYAVWAYFRFPMSLRYVEDLLYKRGVIVSYETIRSWVENLAANMPKSSAVTGLHHQISGTLTRW
jgi:putative transposase